MSMIWLVAALITWPIVAVLVGLLVGRVLAASSAHAGLPMSGLSSPTRTGRVAAQVPRDINLRRRAS